MFAKQKKNCLGIYIFVFVMALIFVIVRGTVIMCDVTDAKAKSIAAGKIGDAVNEYIDELSLLYGNIGSKETSADGRILAINTDVARINSLQNNISDKISDSLKEDAAFYVKFPVFDIIAPGFLTDFGPTLKMRLSPISTVDSRFEDSFVSAGINQTKFSVDLLIDVDVLVSVRPIRRSVHTSQKLPVVRLLLVGSVPGSYAEIRR